MKYKLLKELPLAKAGTEVQLEPHPFGGSEIYHIGNTESRVIGAISEKDIPEWLEEVKEHKTIYDLKKGDKYYVLDDGNEITKYEVPSNTYFNNPYCRFNFFVTEREAKRNKLLRELATRTDKWLPDEREFYTTYNDYMKACTVHWNGKACDMIQYHMGLVFRNEEEYNKYMTEEAKDLLFKI